MRPKVLIVDDDASVRYTLNAILEEEDVDIEEAADGREALDRVLAEPVDLILTDLKMPRMDGMTLLSELKALPNPPRVVMITAFGSERLAVEAMKRGAVDYFAKPFEPDDIVSVVRRNLETVRLADENRSLRAELLLRRHMVFESEGMRQVARMVERVSPRDVTVLITGESGTGKELVARALVDGSHRKDEPYVRFNCAALPRELADAELFGHSRGAFTGAEKARNGLVRQAHKGTLLLDEVGELDPATQGKLLRVLQEKEVRPVGETAPIQVDVRFMAATNRDLKRDVERGRFREDLYYRLHVITIHVPPLAERRADIRPLAQHFAARFGRSYGLGEVRLSPKVLEILCAAPWKGNVRELENVVERMVALADGPVLEQDPFDATSVGTQEGEVRGEALEELSLRERLAVFEKGLVRQELERCGGNQSATARKLGISRTALIDKLKKYNLK